LQMTMQYVLKQILLWRRDGGCHSEIPLLQSS
jgi:hypothetical protein